MAPERCTTVQEAARTRRHSALLPQLATRRPVPTGSAPVADRQGRSTRPAGSRGADSIRKASAVTRTR